MKYTTSLTLLVLAVSALADPPKLAVPPLKSPAEELKTFQVHSGFRVELVVSEPQIADPVSVTFDQDGKLYVCEMRGYPNAGYGTGEIKSGSIKLLTDRDGDGFYETSTTFADGLRFPMGVQPWRKGVIACVAPDLLYLEDTDGDGRADVRKILYTGFGVDNIQQLLNSVQFGMDNWVYACNGASGGTITCPEKPDMKPVVLGNRGIRFKPDVPGSLEPMSGGGQYGLTPTINQEWFTATNSEHLKQIVLPDHYLRRNPAQAAPTPWLNVPEHGPACQVFRISPFEMWRVERTTRRADAPDAARYPKTELVPGGFATSSCSPVIYHADRFPAAYRGNAFICEPANNLIFRDELIDDGPVFKSRRVDQKQEFLASTDNCFRPVHQTIGPDGALYVADFYRPVIETPRSLPDDIKAQLPLQSQGRGRIWRVRPRDRIQPGMPKLSARTSLELVELLEHPDLWWRLTAQRLLVERRDETVIKALTNFGVKRRVHALWILHAWGAPDDAEIRAALESSVTIARCQALRVAEQRPSLYADCAKLADDPSPQVRLQAAFSLGAWESNAPALAVIARRDGANAWTAAAILSSTRASGMALLKELLAAPTPAAEALVPALMAQVGASGSHEQVSELLATIANGPTAKKAPALRALGRAMRDAKRPLPLVLGELPPLLRPLLAVFDDAQAIANNANARPGERVAAIELLEFRPTGFSAANLLDPKQPAEVQTAAVRALAGGSSARVVPELLVAWPSASPALRREIQEALFARTERIPLLLDAIEKRTILPQQLDAARIGQLRKLPDPKLRERAERLLAGAVDLDRQKVIAEWKSSLDLKTDVEKGRAVFRKNCATCHRLEDVGTEVGPDLRTALRDKTSEQLLISILDPSREVDRRYTNYLVETKAGRSMSGMIAAETATSVTLRRAEKAEDVILRIQIESLSDTGKSLMPDGLEKQLSKQDLADVIAYLMSIK